MRAQEAEAPFSDTCKLSLVAFNFSFATSLAADRFAAWISFRCACNDSATSLFTVPAASFCLHSVSQASKMLSISSSNFFDLPVYDEMLCGPAPSLKNVDRRTGAKGGNVKAAAQSSAFSTSM